MTIPAVVGIESAGAVALAVWLAIRFPVARPRTLRSSAGLFGLALLAQAGLGPLAGVTSAALGPAATVCLLLVPYLTWTCWAALQVLRSLVGLLTPTGP